MAGVHFYCVLCQKYYVYYFRKPAAIDRFFRYLTIISALRVQKYAYRILFRELIICVSNLVKDESKEMAYRDFQTKM